MAIAREIGNRRSEGTILSSLGNAYLQLGEARRATGYYEQALTIVGEIGARDVAAGLSFNMALLYAQQGEEGRALPLAQQAAQFYTQLGHAEYAQQAQGLVAQLQGGGTARGDGDTGDPTQLAFEAFQRAGSLADMQRAVTQFPFMIEPGFVSAIERVIAEQVPPQLKPAFEERLASLCRIAQEHK